MKKRILSSYYKFAVVFLLFVFPLQSVWIVQEVFLGGVKWEYGTLVLYGTEVLLWLLFIIQLLFIKKLNVLKNKIVFFCFAFLLVHILIFGLVYDNFFHLAQQFRFLLDAVLFFYVVHAAKLGRTTLFWITAASAMLVSILAITQFFLQAFPVISHLNFAPHYPWVAGTSVIVGEMFGRFARAYGTFSHPNILGGYLSLFFIASWWYWLQNKPKSQREWYLFIFIELVVLAALFVSFSRSAWLSIFLIFPWFLYKAYQTRRNDFFRLAGYLIFFAVILFFMLRPLVIARVTATGLHESRSVSERVTGYTEAFTLLQGNYLFGVGLGQYTRALSEVFPDRPGWEYQPTHNIFLLIFTELGIFGIFVGGFGILVLAKWCKVKFGDYEIFFIFILPISIIGWFDHYMFSVYAGIMFVGWYFVLLTETLEKRLK